MCGMTVLVFKKGESIKMRKLITPTLATILALTMLIVLTACGYIDNVPEAAQKPTPESVAETTPVLTPETEQETISEPEPMETPEPELNVLDAWLETFATIDAYVDMGVEDFLAALDRLFGVSHSVDGDDTTWTYEDDDIVIGVGATFSQGKLNDISIIWYDPADERDIIEAWFDQPSLWSTFDLDRLHALNECIADVIDGYFEAITVVEASAAGNVSYDDIVDMAGGTQGIPITWSREENGFSYMWFNDEYILYASYDRDGEFVFLFFGIHE